MEILDSSESFLHWDRNLSELSEARDSDNVLFSTVSDGCEGTASHVLLFQTHTLLRVPNLIIGLLVDELRF